MKVCRRYRPWGAKIRPSNSVIVDGHVVDDNELV